MLSRRICGGSLAALLMIAVPIIGLGAAETVRYRVIIENTNSGQNFSPPVLVLHDEGYSLFELGEPASEALWRLAEDGATDGFSALPAQDEAVEQVIRGPSVHRRNSPVAEIEFEASDASLLSLASMLTLTNDGFVALRAVALPVAPGETRSEALQAFDAGSEANTESCAHVPCERHGIRMTDGAEGSVSLHPGVRGDAEIPLRRGWQGQVLGTVTITRLE